MMGKPGQQADSWGAFQLRYIAYKKKPTWNLWLHGPNARGRLSPSNIEHMQGDGRRAIARLNDAIRRLKANNRFPSRPSQFHQRDMDRIVRARFLPKRLLPTFWEAVALNRDKYTCQHCSRSVASVWRESKHRRTIGLTLDHLHPRVRGGRSHSFQNTREACWSCNAIKGTLRMKPFREELMSLARALGSGRHSRL